MRVAFFGGTFDPVHLGHLVVARAAAAKFNLDVVYFAPAAIPPHKQKRKLSEFEHRFAMLALATAGDKRFVPSLFDAPTGRPNYSLDTIRRLKKSLKKSDKVFFLVGMDSFKDIHTWHRPDELLAECEFIVASRPGYRLEDVCRALPEKLRPAETALRAMAKGRGKSTLAVRGATVHLLPKLHEAVSSTQIRAAAARSTVQLSRYVPKLVAEYIKKQHLYGRSAVTAEAAPAKVLSLQRGRNHAV